MRIAAVHNPRGSKRVGSKQSVPLLIWLFLSARSNHEHKANEIKIKKKGTVRATRGVEPSDTVAVSGRWELSSS